MFGQRSRSRALRQSDSVRTRHAFTRRIGGFEQLEARLALAVTTQPDVYALDEDAVLDLAPTQTFVPQQAVWNYTTANGDPTLVDPDFNATWHTQGLSGSAYDGPPFAYGLGAFEYGTVDGLFGTIGTSIFTSLLQIPGVPQGLTDTAYFITTFDFDGDPARVTRIVADVLADDGAVFYLNGEEVGRINMGDQPDTFAARAPMPTEEWHFSTAELANRFVAGTNVLAVSVHNVNFQGADMGFDMSLSVTEDRGNVLANDASDLAPPDGALRVGSVNGQAVGDSPATVATQHGSVTMRPDGTFRYVPAENYHGVDAFTYVAADRAGESAPTTVTLEIRAVNDPPVAVDDAYTFAEDTTFVAEAPAVPQIVLPRGATWDYFDELTNGNADGYGGGPATPDEDYPRDALGRAWYEPLFDVTTSDPVIGAWKVGTAPFVQDLGAPAPSAGTVLAGAAPAHTTDLFRTRFSLTVEQAAAEWIWLTGLLDDGGVLYLNGQEIHRRGMPDGPLTTHTFATTILGTGTEVYTSELILVPGLLLPGENVLAVELHQAYVNTSDRIFDLELRLDDPNALGVTANDRDAENSPLIAQLVSPPQHGTVVLEPSGRFTYTPDPDYFGDDSFTYTVMDAGTPPLTSIPATVRLTIRPVADSIVVLPDAFETDEDAVLTGNVLANDSSEDLPLVATLAVAAEHGSVSLASDGTFTYAPEADFFGVDTFRYRATDAVNDFDVVTATIAVHPVNDAPTIAAAPVYGAREDQPLVVIVPALVSRNIVPANAPWEYNQSIAAGTATAPGEYPVDTAHPGVDWNDPGFSTATSTSPWLSGPGPFAAGAIEGISSSGQYTVLENGGVNTILFRTTFSLTAAEAAAASRATLTAIVDDGGVLYVNGREALRVNVPTGVAVTPDTLATAAGSEAPEPYSFDIGGYAVPGANVLAFELHQGPPSLADVVEHLRVSEIMYHPADSMPGVDDDAQYEYLEFVNTSERFAIDLAGVRFTTGISHQFANSTLLGPGERGVIVTNEAAFRTRYGDGPRVLGTYAGQLNNGGEQLRITAQGQVVLDFTYGDGVAPGWPVEADGLGRSLVIVDPNAPTSAWNEATQWRASTNDGGSPGALDPGEPPPQGIDDAAFGAVLSISFADGLLAGASDVEGDSLSIVVLEGPTHGSLVLGANGAFTYTPDRNFYGDDSFRYAIVDDDATNPTTSEPIVATIHVVPDSDIATCEDLDWNQSGAIDGGDVAGIAGRYGASVLPGAEADFNGDGTVGLGDLLQLQASLGASCGAAPSAIVRAAAVDAALVRGDAAEHRIAAVRQRRVGRLAEDRTDVVQSVAERQPVSAASTLRRLAEASGRRAFRQERANRADELV